MEEEDVSGESSGRATVVRIPESSDDVLGGGLAEEEDLLRDVLAQLDVERTRRAEVELQLRQQQEHQHRLEMWKGSEESEILALREEVKRLKAWKEEDAAKEAREQSIYEEARKEAEHKLRSQLTAMRTERDGMQQIVTALTSDLPALKECHDSTVSTDSTDSTSTKVDKEQPAPLELYVTRMLECMPWDARARAHALAVEEFYEWQIFDDKTDQYTHHLKHFPACFKVLPNVSPHKHSQATNHNIKYNDDETLAHSQNITPPTLPGSVLTDHNCAHIIDLSATSGTFPLPTHGTWDWVGPWTVHAPNKSKTSDIHGWSYGALPKNPASSSTPTDNSPTNNQADKTMRRFRRRRWLRKRILLSYPSISESTKHYLALAAQNEKINQNVSKLLRLLQESRMQIHQLEQQSLQQNNQHSQKRKLLEAHLQQKNEIIDSLQRQLTLSAAADAAATSSTNTANFDATLNDDDADIDDALASQINQNSADTSTTITSTNAAKQTSHDVVRGFSKFKTSVKGFVQEKVLERQPKTSSSSSLPTTAAAAVDEKDTTTQEEEKEKEEETSNQLDPSPPSSTVKDTSKTEEMLKHVKGSFSTVLSSSRDKPTVSTPSATTTTTTSSSSSLSWKTFGKGVADSTFLGKIRSSIPLKTSSTTTTTSSSLSAPFLNKDLSTHSGTAIATVSTIPDDDEEYEIEQEYEYNNAYELDNINPNPNNNNNNNNNNDHHVDNDDALHVNVLPTEEETERSSYSSSPMIPLRLGPSLQQIQQHEKARRIRNEHQRMVLAAKSATGVNVGVGDSSNETGNNDGDGKHGNNVMNSQSQDFGGAAAIFDTKIE